MIAGTPTTPTSAIQRSPTVGLPAFSRPGPVALSGALVTLPVFIQAPWVRQAPFSAAAFTACLLTAALLLARSQDVRLRRTGELLVGFCGSWLAGSMFWGWARLHPVCHLPLEAFALPLAVAGLGSRWRLGCGFYLGSLVGTAATDAGIALAGLMPLWPEVLAAPPEHASDLLHLAATAVLEPRSLLVVGCLAAGLVRLSQWCWGRGEAGRVAAAALSTTLAVDALFLLLALVAPWLSGLV